MHASTTFWQHHGSNGQLILNAAGAAAMHAGGAIITQAAGTQPGVNCALYALGEYIGFSTAQSQGGHYGGHAVHLGRGLLLLHLPPGCGLGSWIVSYM